MKKITFTLILSVFGTSNFLLAQENTLNESGNVGIGTTSPSKKLDVNGSVKIDSTLNVKDSAVFEKNIVVQQDIRIEGDSRFEDVHILGNLEVDSLATFHGPVKLESLNTTQTFQNKNILFVDSGGKTTKTPYDSIESILKADILASVYKPVPLGCLVDTAGNVTNPTWYNGTNKLYSYCPEVNVGINTSTPRVKLDVIGTTFTNKIAINKDPAEIGTTFFYLKSNYSLTNPTYGTAPIFAIENPERRIFQVNNNGIVRAREIILDLTTPWPDYVFTPSYQLSSYDELRLFIAKNGHLPNVPSAAAIQETGIEVGELNAVMMEKIEELTLYILELEARIKTLESTKENTEN